MKKEYSPKLLLIILSALIITTFSSTERSVQALTPHDPILIYNNAQFSQLGFPGDGSEEDPYVISNLHFQGPGVLLFIRTYGVTANFTIHDCLFQGTGISIWIMTITSNFTIRDCVFEGGDTTTPLGDTAMYLSNTYKGHILNNTISNYNRGMFLTTSYNNDIRDNEIYNTGEGISMGGQDNIVSNNHIHHNEEGINHYAGRFNVFSGNTIDQHTSNGINIKPSCFNVTVTMNVISDNGRAIKIVNSDNHIVKNNLISENLGGISLYNSVDNCFFANNSFIDNAGTGISISGTYTGGVCENNLIEWNDFISNTDGSITQAFEQRSNPNHPNIFLYNYWDDWTTPDLVAPFGIVDFPYLIDGNANNQDPYPRTTSMTPSIEDIKESIRNLDDNAFNNNPESRRRELRKRLDIAKIMICEGQYQAAINKLGEFRSKCAGGWITDPAAQEELVDMTDALIDDLPKKEEGINLPDGINDLEIEINGQNLIRTPTISFQVDEPVTVMLSITTEPGNDITVHEITIIIAGVQSFQLSSTIPEIPFDIPGGTSISVTVTNLILLDYVPAALQPIIYSLRGTFSVTVEVDYDINGVAATPWTLNRQINIPTENLIDLNT
ncbi:MAG: nitrous oxide reductase family maturation protein NosD [Promethearchaeota archaeon]